MRFHGMLLCIKASLDFHVVPYHDPMKKHLIGQNCFGGIFIFVAFDKPSSDTFLGFASPHTVHFVDIINGLT